MNRQGGNTLVQVVVAIALLVLLVGLFLPAVDYLNRGSKRSARKMKHVTQLRGIHSSMVLFAQGNNYHYPGLDASGDIADASPAGRLQLLLDGNYFRGEYLISPSETKIPWVSAMGPLAPAHYSYALLNLPPRGARLAEWRDTMNTDAVVLSDRGIDNGGGTFRSVHTTPARGVDNWRGSVAWNDNHVTFEADPLVDTQYDTVTNKADHLFMAAGKDDAAMAYAGTSDYISAN